MMQRVSVRIFVAVCLAMALPSQGAAQADPDSVKLRNDCRLAAQILQHGQPAKKRDWAIEQLWRCDPELQVPLVDSLLRSAAYSGSDAEVLEAMDAAWALWDQRILETMWDIASDPGAREEARLRSLMELSVFLSPNLVPSVGFMDGLAEEGLPSGNCFRRSMHPTSPRPVESTPSAAFREELSRDLLELSGRRLASDRLQAAAICAASRG